MEVGVKVSVMDQTVEGHDCVPERTRPVTQPLSLLPACSAASANAAPASAGRAAFPTSPLENASSKRGVPAQETSLYCTVKEQ